MSLVEEQYMRRCFELAKKGLGKVAPNPLVGSVIVHNNLIIGEGWHQQYGEAHAEVNAINSVSIENQNQLRASTIYVNLEPCSHYGKTPPCADLIIEKKIPRVVISTIDSNPKVGGKGVERLRAHGVEVLVDVLKEEGDYLNRRFFTYINKKRPYVILKWAQSTDGYFSSNHEEQIWLTNENSKRLVHLWRGQEAAILVGRRTATIDNPQLTNRFFPNMSQPLRLVIDQNLTLNKNLHLFDHSVSTVVVNSKLESIDGNLNYWKVDFGSQFLEQLMFRLYENEIQSLIIEGGVFTLQQFIDQNLWDEARILTSPIELKQGLDAPRLHGISIEQYSLDKDQINHIMNNQ